MTKFCPHMNAIGEAGKDEKAENVASTSEENAELQLHVGKWHSSKDMSRHTAIVLGGSGMGVAQLWLQNIKQFISSYTNLVSNRPGESDSLQVAKMWCTGMGNLMLWRISETLHSHVSFLFFGNSFQLGRIWKLHLLDLVLEFDNSSFGCKGFWSCWKQGKEQLWATKSFTDFLIYQSETN